MNVELLRKVQDAIRDESTLFGMDYWYNYNNNRYDRRLLKRIAEGDVDWCETAACIAGHTLRIAHEGDALQIDEVAMGGFVEPARAALGLTRPQAEQLFYSYWPDWTDGHDERAGAVAVIDQLIAYPGVEVCDLPAPDGWGE